MWFKIYIKQNIRIYLLISYIRTKKEGISQFSPSVGKPEKSLIYAKKYIIAEKYSFIAERFNYAELYQA